MKTEERNTSTDSIARDVDEVSRQLSSLRQDMAKLAETLADISGRRTSSMAKDIADGLDEAREYARRTGRSTEAQFEGSLATHPFLTIGHYRWPRQGEVAWLLPEGEFVYLAGRNRKSDRCGRTRVTAVKTVSCLNRPTARTLTIS